MKHTTRNKMLFNLNISIHSCTSTHTHTHTHTLPHQSLVRFFCIFSCKAVWPAGIRRVRPDHSCLNRFRAKFRAVPHPELPSRRVSTSTKQRAWVTWWFLLTCRKSDRSSWPLYCESISQSKLCKSLWSNLMPICWTRKMSSLRLCHINIIKRLNVKNIIRCMLLPWDSYEYHWWKRSPFGLYR